LGPLVGRYRCFCIPACSRCGGLRASIRALELEDAPPLLVVRTTGFAEHAVRVFGDDARPEQAPAMVFIGHAHSPSPGKAIPQLERRLPTKAAATMPTHYEEFGDIEYVRVIRHRRSAGDKGESRKEAAAADKERKSPVGFGPIQGQLFVSEPSVRSQLKGECGAQVVRVQLEQVCHGLRVGRRRRLDCDLARLGDRNRQLGYAVLAASRTPGAFATVSTVAKSGSSPGAGAFMMQRYPKGYGVQGKPADRFAGPGAFLAGLDTRCYPGSLASSNTRRAMVIAVLAVGQPE